MLSNSFKQDTSILKIFWIVCFVVYMAVLIKLILFKYPDTMMNDILRSWSAENLIRHIQITNLIPFKTIGNSLFNTQLQVEIPTLIYNIIAFAPLGFLLPCLRANFRKLKAVLLPGFMVSLGFEIIQLVSLLGDADIDDVILNVLGTIIGYGIFMVLFSLYPRIYTRQPL